MANYRFIEAARMGLQSRKPFIGWSGLNWLGENCATKNAQRYIKSIGTMPARIKITGKYWKIDHRLRKILNDSMGLDNIPAPLVTGVIIDYDTGSVMQTKPRETQTLQEATAQANKLSKAIRNTSRKDVSAQTPSHSI